MQIGHQCFGARLCLLVIHSDVRMKKSSQRSRTFPRHESDLIAFFFCLHLRFSMHGFFKVHNFSDRGPTIVSRSKQHGEDTAMKDSDLVASSSMKPLF